MANNIRGTRGKGNKARDSRKPFDFDRVESHGVSTTALVVEAGKLNEHSELEETVLTHLVPRKSITTKQGLRLFGKRPTEQMVLRGKQLLKVVEQYCPKVGCGLVAPIEDDSQGNRVTHTFCWKCRTRLQSRLVPTNKMVNVTNTITIRQSDDTLLSKRVEFKQNLEIRRVGSRDKNNEALSDRKLGLGPDGNDSTVKDNEYQLTEYETDRLFPPEED